ncbi:unnamed protein product [Scytosiphon promiscuus]
MPVIHSAGRLASTSVRVLHTHVVHRTLEFCRGCTLAPLCSIRKALRLVRKQDDAEGGSNDAAPAASLPSKSTKRKLEHGDEQRPPPQQRRRQQQQPAKEKKQKRNKATTPKKAAAKKATPVQVETVAQVSEVIPDATPKINPHRAKILVAKKALAAIKAGTRIYIKSGEGNGGDTWWDSGVIQKIHERGKPFEVEWEKINNRGEEVDTGVEKRIILPVTYSLAGAAAEAIRAAVPGTQAAVLARKSVLAEARIGSWCIKHPEEPWGMLDPFGEDSSLAPPPAFCEPSS